MPADRIEEQLALLLRALYGEERNNVPGLVRRVDEIQQTLTVMAAERQQWREETERRLAALEQNKPVLVSERTAWIAGVFAVIVMATMLAALLLNGRLG